MPRPSQADEKREKLLPIVARAFAELGYRRATTAELAQRCEVRENILYRLWPDKKAMFIASIDYVYEQAAEVWQEVLGGTDATEDVAVRLLQYEANHYGESGLHRIVFAGLSEVDEPEIREALRKMYSRFHRFIRGHIAAHRNGEASSVSPDETATAWAIVGLGNVANIGRELGLLSNPGRKKMFSAAGRLLLDGQRE
ncbi:MAG: TetR/AcrR family transcriptional regulator [Planctomycetota bacterium]|jgi:AcrR family transcriptional regulator